MIPKLVDAKYIDGYRVWLKFEDGTEGDLNLERELWGEVFEPLRDVKRFRAFKLDRELNTLVWSSGADLAPEFLYTTVTAQQADQADAG